MLSLALCPSTLQEELVRSAAYGELYSNGTSTYVGQRGTKLQREINEMKNKNF